MCEMYAWQATAQIGIDNNDSDIGTCKVNEIERAVWRSEAATTGERELIKQKTLDQTRWRDDPEMEVCGKRRCRQGCPRLFHGAVDIGAQPSGRYEGSRRVKNSRVGQNLILTDWLAIGL